MNSQKIEKVLPSKHLLLVLGLSEGEKLAFFWDRVRGGAVDRNTKCYGQVVCRVSNPVCDCCLSSCVTKTQIKTYADDNQYSLRAVSLFPWSVEKTRETRK